MNKSVGNVKKDNTTSNKILHRILATDSASLKQFVIQQIRINPHWNGSATYKPTWPGTREKHPREDLYLCLLWFIQMVNPPH